VLADPASTPATTRRDSRDWPEPPWRICGRPRPRRHPRARRAGVRRPVREAAGAGYGGAAARCRPGRDLVIPLRQVLTGGKETVTISRPGPVRGARAAAPSLRPFHVLARTATVPASSPWLAAAARWWSGRLWRAWPWLASRPSPGMTRRASARAWPSVPVTDQGHRPDQSSFRFMMSTSALS
jgi:hypothetical protein